MLDTHSTPDEDTYTEQTKWEGKTHTIPAALVGDWDWALRLPLALLCVLCLISDYLGPLDTSNWLRLANRTKHGSAHRRFKKENRPNAGVGATLAALANNANAELGSEETLRRIARERGPAEAESALSSEAAAAAARLRLLSLAAPFGGQK